ncbi:translation elongation factor Ts [Rhodocaloribacter litoris]|uniref:translation elongation factor Ts n=1 Tax=Rhodocaloribacter litoris TaxID=2558931 RepID=UPI00141E5942|nr:translation elongation factor Ts [Rhodocaloribacter litoris]QXD13797.1 translation elongation factor Ts [Rhodocaloribacter litoris]
MAISAQDVKRLREITGVGMMDCKKALEEAGGDFDAAIELLRKKGQKVAAKRADREANEGLVVTAATDDRRTAVLVEVNCETDFVARNEEFQQFARQVAELALRERPADREALLALPFENGRTVADALTDLTGKIGEKIDVRRFALLESEDGQVISYIHPGARLGVLVEVQGDGDVESVGRDVAMQVAALNPVALSVEEVPEDVKAKELEIAREAARNEGKPEHILENIAQGKLKRFFKDNVLIEQPFVKDASMTVKEMLRQAGATVKRYVRFALGG